MYSGFEAGDNTSRDMEEINSEIATSDAEESFTGREEEDEKNEGENDGMAIEPVFSWQS